MPSLKTQRYVWERDNGICVYCGEPANVLDHIIRWADGGPEISSNLVCACAKCNSYKGKHPRGLKQVTRALFWLIIHGENISWMDSFYPEIEQKLKRPKMIKPIEYILPKMETRPIVVPVPEHKETIHKTKAFAIRLPIKVIKILERRITKAHNRWASISEYLKDRIIYDAMRKR